MLHNKFKIKHLIDFNFFIQITHCYRVKFYCIKIELYSHSKKLTISKKPTINLLLLSKMELKKEANIFELMN